MPRPKGSKNKSRLLVEDVDEKLAGVDREISRLSAALKTARAERRTLARAKQNADALAAAQRAEAQQRALLAAVEASGKSVEEVLAMLR